MHSVIQNSNIYIDINLLSNSALFADLCRKSRLVLVTETYMQQHYLITLLPMLQGNDYSILTLSGGESNKNWASVEKIIQHLIEQQHDRDSILISFAGGVVGDLCGFAASIYMRGINWIQIPTTLLAQVDAAVGGKTGCNFAGHKNLIGSFHQPLAVLCDPQLILSLPEREYLAGLAEVVKYGMSCDADFFCWLEANVNLIKQRDLFSLQAIITRCCNIKASIVAQDERDHGLRMVLNFGHTFAHALESASGFEQYLHGEAVSIGMLLVTHLAVKLKLVDSDLLVRLRSLLVALGINTQYDSARYSMRMLFEYLKFDKKRQGAALRLILPCALGQVRALQYTDVNYLEGLMDGYANS